MAIRRDLTINQGETFSVSLFIEDENDLPVDLTDYVGSAQMRRHYTSLIAYDFNVIVSEVEGIITLSLSDSETSVIPAGRYQWDCNITDPDSMVTKISYGIVEVVGGVTR